MRYVAFLRGINVGGRHSLAMSDLSDLAQAIGLLDPVTYLQSGNLLFTAPKQAAASLSSRLAESLADAAGFEIPVVVRSAPQMALVAERHPFEQLASQPKELFVMFLSGLPSAQDAAQLDPARGGTDVFELIGQELYLHLTSAARTKLSVDYVGRVLKLSATARNWNTVTAVAGMLAEH